MNLLNKARTAVRELQYSKHCDIIEFEQFCKEHYLPINKTIDGFYTSDVTIGAAITWEHLKRNQGN